MTAEYEVGEANGQRRIREYKQGENSMQTNKREHHRKKEEATRIREYELEEKRDREDRRRKEEATRRLYEVAQVEEEVKKEKKKKKIIGTRFFDPKERRVVDTRRTYLEREEENYFAEEAEQPKTAAPSPSPSPSPRPRQRRKQRPKPTEKIFYEEEKIGPEKKNLRFEIKAEEKKKKPVSQSEEWGSKMWSEIKADEKFGWGEKGVRIVFLKVLKTLKAREFIVLTSFQNYCC